MIRRPMLSILVDTDHWLHGRREQTAQAAIPSKVRRELLTMAALLPLAAQLLGAPWERTVMMMDASEEGGGICSAEGSLPELRFEGSWAAKGGWAVFTGEQEAGGDAASPPPRMSLLLQQGGCQVVGHPGPRPHWAQPLPGLPP